MRVPAAGILVLAIAGLVGCGGSSGPEVVEAGGAGATQADRINSATSILGKDCTLPGALTDAHIAEEVQDNSGGFVPGPSEVRIFGVITIDPADLPKWKALLDTGRDGDFSASLFPSTPPSWFPTKASLEAGSPQIYHCKPLVGRSAGWAALSEDKATITFFGFNP